MNRERILDKHGVMGCPSDPCPTCDTDPEQEHTMETPAFTDGQVVGRVQTDSDTFEIRYSAADAHPYSRPAQFELYVWRTFTTWSGTTKTDWQTFGGWRVSAELGQDAAVAKLSKTARKQSDTWRLHAANLDTARRLASEHAARTGALPREDGLLRDPQVGDSVWVWGQNRWRPSVVVKVTKTKLHTLFTTPTGIKNDDRGLTNGTVARAEARMVEVR